MTVDNEGISSHSKLSMDKILRMWLCEEKLFNYRCSKNIIVVINLEMTIIKDY